MGRTYVRKTTRQSWSKDSMKTAMRNVKFNGKSVNSAAKEFNIPEPTLRRYLKKYPDEDVFPSNAGRFKTTFSEEQLQNLYRYIVDIDQRAFGLTKEQFGRVIFDYAENRKIPHRFNNEKKRASRHFVEWFMKKFNLSLRSPEATSVARLMAFNRENVNKFFDALRELKQRHGFKPHQIYNLDETGISTVATKNPKVITPKGKRRVVKISSAERGTNVTGVCCMNASGSFVPPFLIFPRVRMQPAFMNNTPPGFVGVAHESGWMTADTFIKYLEHFIQYVRPSENNRILLLMDNHASHVTLEAINLCRDNHIILLGFPAHTSHRMQPLDVSLYGPLKTAYSRVCDDFLSNNPGRVITLYDIASLFGQAYLKVATVSNAMSGFRASGIEPFDSQIFTEADFEAARTTDRDAVTPVPVTDVSELSTSNIQLEAEVIEAANENKVLPSTSNVSSDKAESVSIQSRNGLESTCTSNKENSNKELNCGLPALPQAEPKVRRPRKKLPSLIISSTPVKEALEQKESERKEKRIRMRGQKQTKNKKLVESVKKLRQKRVAIKKTNNAKRQIKFDDSSDSTSSTEIAYADTDDDMDPEYEEDDKTCLICMDEGKDKELWFQCFSCKLWAHAECTELSVKEAKVKTWFCYRCIAI